MGPARIPRSCTYSIPRRSLATVREVILGLGVDAASKITWLARGCGAKMGSGASATSVNGAINMAVVVQDNQAVALTVAGYTTLSESRKIAVLYQAATLADR